MDIFLPFYAESTSPTFHPKIWCWKAKMSKQRLVLLCCTDTTISDGKCKMEDVNSFPAYRILSHTCTSSKPVKTPVSSYLEMFPNVTLRKSPWLHPHSRMWYIAHWHAGKLDGTGLSCCGSTQHSHLQKRVWSTNSCIIEGPLIGQYGGRSCCHWHEFFQLADGEDGRSLCLFSPVVSLWGLGAKDTKG